jgi:putative membrane protein
MRLLIRWLMNAVSLLIVARFVTGFKVSGFKAALIAALVIGLVNATLGAVLKVLTFPLTVLTLGLFMIVINALMLKLAALIMPGLGFEVTTWTAAFLGAILLSIISGLLHWLTRDKNKAKS